MLEVPEPTARGEGRWVNGKDRVADDARLALAARRRAGGADDRSGGEAINVDRYPGYICAMYCG